MNDLRNLATVAGAIQRDADRLTGKGQSSVASNASLADAVALYDALVTSPELRQVSRRLYVDGHYAEAVEAAFKCLNNTVKSKAGSVQDGQDLMLKVFSEDKPVLRLNKLRTETEQNEQAGYRFIFAGVMRGIRNPRAHEHLLRDEPGPALEMLVLANHLMRVVERSTRARTSSRSGGGRGKART